MAYQVKKSDKEKTFGVVVMPRSIFIGFMQSAKDAKQVFKLIRLWFESRGISYAPDLGIRTGWTRDGDYTHQNFELPQALVMQIKGRPGRNSFLNCYLVNSTKHPIGG